MTEQQTPQQPVKNPLLIKARLPGETFTLPSGGIFYKKNEVDDSVLQSAGEFMLYPMVTMDEITIKTPDKLLNGTALTEVLSRCAPSLLKPMDMLAKDIDYILICMRKISYGNEYEIQYTHDCKDAKEHRYLLPLVDLITTAKRIDASKVNTGYKLTLPNQQLVSLVPPTYSAMLKFYQGFKDSEEDLQKIGGQILETTVSMIESVDGITDVNMIREWINTIPPEYINKIGDRVAELSTWGPDLEQKLECRDCKQEIDIEVSLNPISFFS